MRSIEFEGIENVRDLGGLRVGGNRAVKPGLLLRGSALYNVSEGDAARLRSLGISKVIDVRVGWEREAKPDALPDGAQYRYIPFFDKETLGIDYMKPVPGTKVIGSDFACDPRDFYRTMANPITAGQMGKAVNEALDCAAAGETVYFHCSGGKDRAGILALLILETLGASREDILEDYLLTNISRDRNIAGIYQRFLRLCEGDEKRAREITDEHRARPENLEAFYAEVDARYSSMDDFIRNQLGISDARRATLRSACTQVI